MLALGIKKVYYSDADGNIIFAKTSQLQSNHICKIRKIMRLA